MMGRDNYMTLGVKVVIRMTAFSCYLLTFSTTSFLCCADTGLVFSAPKGEDSGETTLRRKHLFQLTHSTQFCANFASSLVTVAADTLSNAVASVGSRSEGKTLAKKR